MSAKEIRREAKLDAIAVVRLYCHDQFADADYLLSTTVDPVQVAQVACQITAALMARFEAEDQLSILHQLLRTAVES